jgi:hypothetical protein
VKAKGDKSVRMAAILCGVVVLVAISVMIAMRSTGAAPGSGRPATAGPVYKTPEEQALEKFEREAIEKSQKAEQPSNPGTKPPSTGGQ